VGGQHHAPTLNINGSVILSWMFLTTCEENNGINRVQGTEKKRANAKTVIFLWAPYERVKYYSKRSKIHRVQSSNCAVIRHDNTQTLEGSTTCFGIFRAFLERFSTKKYNRG
jgi:hypothetical protein